jgi:hypothetical protein
MRQFWDYKARSVEQVLAALDALSWLIGDPVDKLKDFYQDMNTARHFACTTLGHVDGCGLVWISYTVPDSMLRVEIEADDPSTVHKKRFAQPLSKYLKEVKRVPVPEVPYIF